MRPKIKYILSGVLIAIFLGVFIWAGCKLIKYANECKESTESYEAAQNAIQIETQSDNTIEKDVEIVEDPNKETDPIEEYDEYKELKIKIDVDWDSLLSQSQDVVGWLYIPNSNMNYPLVQRDNMYYLDHDYLGKYNSGGAIFLDQYVDMHSKNVIVYGHHMKADIMFHRLVNYAGQKYADEHQYIYVATGDEIRLYKVFSVVYVDGSSDTYTSEFDDSGLTFEKYINRAIENSVINTDTREITEDDKIISLSTCSGRSNTERLVVHAVLLTTY